MASNNKNKNVNKSNKNRNNSNNNNNNQNIKSNKSKSNNSIDNNNSDINNNNINYIDNNNNVNKITSVLFVCFGNVCRSPMAEAIFNHEIVKRQLNDRFIVDSCATGGFHVGREPEGRARIVCKNNKVPIKHQSRKICEEDFFKFDYILCMDNKNLEDLLKIVPENSKAKVQLFGKYYPEKEIIIEDPFFSKGISKFCSCFDELTACSLGFLRFLGFLN